MRKKGSLGNYTISELCFVVYPVSLQLQKQPPAKLFFYFEKNLQIISKTQAPNTFTQQKGVLHFSCPIYIQHFRTQSDKNLDYQWSLYMGDDQTEQLVETQKINLERVWTEYQSKKQPVYSNTVSFNKIKCKLTYLITIGNSNESALDNVKTYFRSIGVPCLVEQTQEKLPTLADEKREEINGEVSSPSPRKTDGNKEQNNSNIAQQKGNEVFSSPPRASEIEQTQGNTEGGQSNNIVGVNEVPHTDQTPFQMTSSEKQLGNALDIDVSNVEVKKTEDTVQKNEQTVLPILKKTETQLITPPPVFKNPKYAVMILIVLMLLVGGVFVNRKFDILSSLRLKPKQGKQNLGGKAKNKVKK